ncbi:hypothetical protein E2320_003102 [Naja naja]|nr:hypothetical protein E2320_003102 [Naja naja]
MEMIWYHGTPDSSVDNSSTSFELINISQFVDAIPSCLRNLSMKIETITSEEKHADFKNCTIIQSQIAGI